MPVLTFQLTVCMYDIAVRMILTKQVSLNTLLNIVIMSSCFVINRLVVEQTQLNES